ncbi:MAG: hypothetical protein R6U61_08640 [Thermoplasmata archaeon]
MQYEFDEEDYLHGRILYQDSKKFTDKERGKIRLSGIAFIAMGIIMLGFAFWTMNENFKLGIFLALFGAFPLIIGYFVYRQKVVRFKVYETGLRFSNESIDFLPFREIERVEIRQGRRWKTPYLVIVCKDGGEYIIAGGSMKHVHEIPENYKKASRAIQKKLLEVNPGAEKHEVIWDVYNLEWTERANRRLPEGRFGFGTIPRMKISEKVLKEGRDKVTEDDVIRFK